MNRKVVMKEATEKIKANQKRIMETRQELSGGGKALEV
jgi:hypothetical protein